MSLSTNVSNLATRIATEVKAIRTLVNGNAADLSSLSTTEKSNLVAAINELKDTLGSSVSDMAGNTVSDKLSSINNKIGNTMMLPSGAMNVVDAINDLKDLLDNIDLTSIIDDNNTTTTTTWSSSKISEVYDVLGSGVSANPGQTVSEKLSSLYNTIGDTMMYPGGFTSVVDELEELKGLIDNIDLSALINDEATATNTTWSSQKISDNISSAVLAVVDMAPEALDTLNELAAALGDDANYASTITTALSGKADSSHTHAISDVTGLQNALDAKASSANVGDTTVDYVETFEAGLV